MVKSLSMSYQLSNQRYYWIFFPFRFVYRNNNIDCITYCYHNSCNRGVFLEEVILKSWKYYQDFILKIQLYYFADISSISNLFLGNVCSSLLLWPILNQFLQYHLLGALDHQFSTSNQRKIPKQAILQNTYKTNMLYHVIVPCHVTITTSGRGNYLVRDRLFLLIILPFLTILNSNVITETLDTIQGFSLTIYTKALTHQP